MLRNLILLIASVGIAFLLGEATARVFDLPPDVDSEGFILPPVEFTYDSQTNAKGWHDVEHAEAKPPGTRRFLVIGDSYVAARHVSLDSTFYRILERRLNDHRADSDVEVIAIGKSGWDQRDELDVLRKEGLEYDPDFVILCLLAWNDVTGNSPELRKIAQEQKSLVEKRPRLSRAPISTLRGLVAPWSRFNRFISYRLTLLYARYEYIFDKTVSRDSTIPIDYFVFSQEPNPLFDRAWAATESLVVRIDQETRAAGARLVVVSLTMPQSYYDGGIRDLQRAFPAMLDRAFDLTRPDSILTAIAARHEIPLLVLGPPFRERFARNGIPLHFPVNGHWNEAGHRAASEELGEYIERSGWIRGASR